MEGELLILTVLLAAVTLLTWLIEGPVGRWVASCWQREECISDAQSTSEKGLW